MGPPVVSCSVMITVIQPEPPAIKLASAVNNAMSASRGGAWTSILLQVATPYCQPLQGRCSHLLIGIYFSLKTCMRFITSHSTKLISFGFSLKKLSFNTAASVIAISLSFFIATNTALIVEYSIYAMSVKLVLVWY